MTRWTTEDIPNLQGHVALITGANSGLGLETTRALAQKGAHVVMACRNVDKARAAQTSIITTLPDASLELASLDLASLTSIHNFVTAFLEKHTRLDLLFNNAGVMAIPRSETQDGFEMQLGTNYLGHFALTGLLMSTLLNTPQSRIITTTSVARFAGKINLDDLQSKRSYSRWSAYGQSKRADLLFAFELQHRLLTKGVSTISVAAHPGYAKTELQSTSATLSGSAVEHFFNDTLGSVISQSAAMGALPQLYAATASTLHGGELIGPDGLFSMKGYPKQDSKSQKEYNQSTATQLWDVSVDLTGVDYAPLQ